VAESEQRGKQLSQAAAERDALIAQLGESQGLAGRLRDEARTREAALAATSEDLRQMIRENQLVNDESQSSAAAAAQMRRELDEARENSVFLQQVVQAFEAEKEELLEAYTRLGEEASAAQSSSHALEAECDTLRKYAHGVEQALKAATEHAIAQENAVAMALSAGLTESHLSRALLHDNTNGVRASPPHALPFPPPLCLINEVTVCRLSRCLLLNQRPWPSSDSPHAVGILCSCVSRPPSPRRVGWDTSISCVSRPHGPTGCTCENR